MQVHVIMKLARQYEGEYVFVSALAAFTDKLQADKFVANYKFNKEENISGIDCLIEIGLLYDIEVDKQVDE